MSEKTHKALSELLAEVEGLCRVYVGKNAESEDWGQTCKRFARLDKLAKKSRKALAQDPTP